MAQVIKYTDKGIGIVSLGDDVKSIGSLKPGKLKVGEGVFLWFNDHFDYYSLNTGIVLDDDVPLQTVIVAAGKTGIVLGIFLFIKGDGKVVLNRLASVYGEPSLDAISSAGGGSDKKKKYWKLVNGVSICLIDNDMAQEVVYCMAGMEDHLPGVSFS